MNIEGKRFWILFTVIVEARTKSHNKSHIHLCLG